MVPEPEDIKNLIEFYESRGWDWVLPVAFMCDRIIENHKPVPAGGHVEAIARDIFSHLGISHKFIQHRSRRQDVVKARYIAMFVARKTTGEKLERIGSIFGRSHSAVLHAIGRVRGDRAMIEIARQFAAVDKPDRLRQPPPGESVCIENRIGDAL